jgi:succinate dehydrogenase / fumarate reductase cytochrome b subunit
MRYHHYHAPVPPPDRSRLVHGAFSLSGVLPLGAFLVLHLSVNLRALRGEAAFASAVDAIQRARGLWLLELAVVFAPLALHGALGLWMAVTRRSLRVPSPYSPGVAAAMRATGLVVAAFLAAHLLELRFGTPGGRLDGRALGSVLAADLSATRFGVPWRAVGYLVATGCVAFHFAAGSWGIYARAPRAASSARARRWAAWAAGAVGLALGLGAADVVVFHATGARMLGGERADERPTRACP